MDNMIDARRKETEAYWRDKITREIMNRIFDIPKENGGYCHVIHLCEVEEAIEMSAVKS
jgi:uncharacterized protein Yka (UPF0111/DUF47 family)